MAYTAPGGTAPSTYGGSAPMTDGNVQRNNIARAMLASPQAQAALNNIQQPPPVMPMPQQPPMPQMGPPLAAQNRPGAFPGGGQTGAVPGAPTAAQPMGGAPMPMQPGGQLPPTQMPGGAPMPPGAQMPTQPQPGAPY
jgi:hypothetical protein